MKIRSQMLIAQIPIALIIIFITGFFIFTLTALEYRAESILVDNFKSIISMQRLNDAAEELNSYSLYHPGAFDPGIKKLESKIEQEVLFQEKSITPPGEEKNLTISLRKKWEAYKESLHPLSLPVSTEKPYKDLKKITSEIISLNQDALVRKKNDLSNFILDYRLFISTTVILTLIFGFYMSWLFTGLFLSPLNKMTDIVSQFGKTDETVLLHIKGSQELEKLSEEFNLMTNRLEEYHQSSLGHVIENYENLKGAFDALPDPLLLFDQRKEITFMNQAAMHLFGILGNSKKHNLLLYLEQNVKKSLLKIVKSALLSHPSDAIELLGEPIGILKKSKKTFFVPHVYFIKKIGNGPKVTGVLILLQDLTRQSLSEQETGKVCRVFIHDFREPLAEIQMAIYTVTQETVGPLTEKQKELLFVARDRCEEMEKLYRDFRKVGKILKGEEETVISNQLSET